MHEKSLKYFVFIEKMPIFVMIVEEGLVVGSTAPWSFPEAVLPGNDIVDACEAVRGGQNRGIRRKGLWRKTYFDKKKAKLTWSFFCLGVASLGMRSYMFFTPLFCSAPDR